MSDIENEDSAVIPIPCDGCGEECLDNFVCGRCDGTLCMKCFDGHDRCENECPPLMTRPTGVPQPPPPQQEPCCPHCNSSKYPQTIGPDGLPDKRHVKSRKIREADSRQVCPDCGHDWAAAPTCVECGRQNSSKGFLVVCAVCQRKICYRCAELHDDVPARCKR